MAVGAGREMRVLRLELIIKTICHGAVLRRCLGRARVALTLCRLVAHESRSEVPGGLALTLCRSRGGSLALIAQSPSWFQAAASYTVITQ